jgi:hypothetical protein
VGTLPADYNSFMGMEAFVGGFSADFLQIVFQDRCAHCSYAVRAVENTWSEHCKMECLSL